MARSRLPHRAWMQLLHAMSASVADERTFVRDLWMTPATGLRLVGSVADAWRAAGNVVDPGRVAVEWRHPREITRLPARAEAIRDALFDAPAGRRP